MKEKSKAYLVLGLVSMLSIFAIFQVIPQTHESKVYEKPYAFLYAVGAIPNYDKELPLTGHDKVLAISNDGTKALVEHPLGLVYERNI